MVVQLLHPYRRLLMVPQKPQEVDESLAKHLLDSQHLPRAAEDQKQPQPSDKGHQDLFRILVRKDSS